MENELEKDGCYSTFPEFKCPDYCPGFKSKFVRDLYGGEGYYVQLCGNPAKQGKSPSGVNYNGLGPDVVVFFQPDFPTDDEIRSVADDIL